MRNVIFFSACLFIASGFGLSYCYAEQEEKTQCFIDRFSRHIALEGVEKVNVSVRYAPASRRNYVIPTPLLKKNLEQYLIKAYKQRFFSSPRNDCRLLWEEKSECEFF